MADSIVNVKTVDIQLVDADRANATTVKLDNPKENLTREMVSAAMQPAFSNGWFLTSKGTVAMYLGDVTINESIKTKLGGEDFYVTPSSITFNAGTAAEGVEIQVSGATIQGYNVKYNADYIDVLTVKIADNGLSATVSIDEYYESGKTITLILIIQGTAINIPISTT